MTAAAESNVKLVVCANNTGYEASLERRKLYSAIADAQAKRHELVRVIDESGDDYLYPESFFVPVALPPATRQAVLAAASRASPPLAGAAHPAPRGASRLNRPGI